VFIRTKRPVCLHGLPGHSPLSRTFGRARLPAVWSALGRPAIPPAHDQETRAALEAIAGLVQDLLGRLEKGGLPCARTSAQSASRVGIG